MQTLTRTWHAPLLPAWKRQVTLQTTNLASQLLAFNTRAACSLAATHPQLA